MQGLTILSIYGRVDRFLYVHLFEPSFVFDTARLLEIDLTKRLVYGKIIAVAPTSHENIRLSF